MNFAKKLTTILLSISCLMFLSCRKDGYKGNIEKEAQSEDKKDAYGIKILIINNSEKSFFLDKTHIDPGPGLFNCKRNGNIKEIYIPSIYDYYEYWDITSFSGAFDVEILPHKHFYFYTEFFGNDKFYISDLFFSYHINPEGAICTDDEVYSTFDGFAEEIKYYFYASPIKYSYGNIKECAKFITENGIRLEGKFVGDTLVFAIR